MSAPPTDLVELEERALEHLVEQIGQPAEPRQEEWEAEPPLPPLRVGLVVAFPTMAAAVMIGMLFEGIAGKAYPAIAGICGIAIAAQASRRKRALAANATILLGLFLTGILLVLPAGFDNVTALLSILKEAKGAGRVLRPPAELLPGFRAIIGWMMASVGFAAGWVGIEMRRPSMGMLVPLPLIAMGAISVPDRAKLAAGLIALVLFIVGLALHSSLSNMTAGNSEAPSLGYEIRRAMRAAPLLAGLVVLMLLLAKTNVMFPRPLYDPVRQAQRPRPIPLSQATDRVLFEVRSRSTGPWRLGLLDIYEAGEWKLPAFAESELKEVPRSGVVDASLRPGVRADFLVQGLGGAVLPGVPNTYGILAEGPELAYDPRTGNIRLAEGQIRAGLAYTAVAAALPTELQLKAVSVEVPGGLQRFTAMPPAPVTVARLLAEAPAAPTWDRLEFVRKRFLETVVASGAGAPVPVTPARVDDMLAGSREGSPFEIVAAQAMLARWAGIPARIGYGFDGGDVLSEGVRAVHPKHGASWLEINLGNYGWLPIIGSPLKAKTSLSAEGPTNPDANVKPSTDIAVEIWIPLRQQEQNLFYKQMQRILLLLALLALIVALVYYSFPAAWKAFKRSRRRAFAAGTGPVARIEVAYAEFRDFCTDLGIGASHRTPLAFLQFFVDDDEHTELAWLITRTLWGDLRDRVSDADAAAAEELVRSMRRRLAQTQPMTLRLIAAVSRRSVHDPYLAEIDIPSRKERRDASLAA